MADPAQLPISELQNRQYLGAVVYLSAYLMLMHRELGVDDASDEYLRMTTLQMVMPMNHATEAIWRALMKDADGMEKAVQEFRAALHAL